MRKDKRWVRTEEIVSMKETDKQTRQSVRMEKRRLWLDVLNEPTQATKGDIVLEKNAHTSNIIRGECNTMWSREKERLKEEEMWHKEKKREGGEAEADEQGELDPEGKLRPAYLMKQADEPN